MTGVSFYDIPVTGKRLALLRELIPKAETIAILQDPNSGTFQSETREIEAAVRATGQKIIFVKAGSEQEINAAFSTVAKLVPVHYWWVEVNFLTVDATN
jgi:putative ABC transport system substrate-binding protein